MVVPRLLLVGVAAAFVAIGVLITPPYALGSHGAAIIPWLGAAVAMLLVAANPTRRVRANAAAATTFACMTRAWALAFLTPEVNGRRLATAALYLLVIVLLTYESMSAPKLWRRRTWV